MTEARLESSPSPATRIAVGPSFVGELAFAGALGFASAGTVQKYLGTATTFLYLSVLLVGVPVARRYGYPLFLRLTTERSALWLAIITYLGLAVAFAFTYPHVNTHAPGTGSDRDDDGNVATSRLLHSHYPYYGVTYLGNHLSHMPGSVLLAIPFVALGTSALQNLFWLPAFFIGLRWKLASTRAALFALWVLLAASPAVLREFLTGGDLISNNIYVILLALVVLEVRHDSRWGRAAEIAFGVALSSRLNFLLVVPLFFAAYVRVAGLRTATRGTALSFAAFAVVTLPFYLYDPRGFSPIHSSNHLLQFDAVLPHAHVLILAAAAVMTLVLAGNWLLGGIPLLWWGIALVQAFVLVCAVALGSVQSHHVDFSFLISGYGLDFLFFAMFAYWVGATPRS